MKLIDSIVAQSADMRALGRGIHAHPELGFEEARTADVVAKKLTEWGIPIHQGMGVTGIVGIIKNGNSTRAIGLRADMDALPVQEFNTFSHASQHQGKMHACMHACGSGGHTPKINYFYIFERKVVCGCGRAATRSACARDGPGKQAA